MKYLFKLLLFFISINILALEGILVLHSPEQIERAKLIRSTLIEELFIPEVLIEMRNDPIGCVFEEDVLWQICLDGDEIYYPVHKQELLKKSYQIFWN